jgi:hypothetical protein
MENRTLGLEHVGAVEQLSELLLRRHPEKAGRLCPMTAIERPDDHLAKATLCDARERELCDLDVRSAGVMVPMPYALASAMVWL